MEIIMCVKVKCCLENKLKEKTDENECLENFVFWK